MATAAPVAEAPARRPSRRRFAVWGVVSALLALVVVAPLVALPASFFGGEDLFDPIAVDEAGPLLDDAVQLMLDVGWN